MRKSEDRKLKTRVLNLDPWGSWDSGVTAQFDSCTTFPSSVMELYNPSELCEDLGERRHPGSPFFSEISTTSKHPLP